MLSAEPTPRVSRILRQIVSFGAVGVLATVIHALIFTTLSLATPTAPQLANIIAFVATLPVSYFGNMRLTFQRRPTVWRFLAVAIAGYGLNAANIHVVELLGGPPTWALPGMLVVIPGLLFLASRYWVYRADAG